MMGGTVECLTGDVRCSGYCSSSLPFATHDLHQRLVVSRKIR